MIVPKFGEAGSRSGVPVAFCPSNNVEKSAIEPAALHRTRDRCLLHLMRAPVNFARLIAVVMYSWKCCSGMEIYLLFIYRFHFYLLLTKLGLYVQPQLRKVQPQLTRVQLPTWERWPAVLL